MALFKNFLSDVLARLEQADGMGGDFKPLWTAALIDAPPREPFRAIVHANSAKETKTVEGIGFTRFAKRLDGFTLTEVVISLGISALLISGIISGYVLAIKRAEWSAYSLAAHSLAMQQVEQARAAKWDPQGWPAVDELVSSNFPNRVEVLDIPISGTNLVYATNFTTITQVSTNPPLKMIRVDCVWTFRWEQLFTNTLITYRAGDQ